MQSMVVTKGFSLEGLQCKISEFVEGNLFMIQVVCALMFGIPQAIRMLTTAEGVNMSMFTSFDVFIVLNILLAMRAHRAQPSQKTKETLLIYALWAVIVNVHLGIMLVRGTGRWQSDDTTTMIIVGMAALLILGLSYGKGLGISDPLTHGYLSGACKGIPQLAMAYRIAMVGGAGVAGMTVAMGHVTVLTRLWIIVKSIREAGWDRNRRGLMISELANELSWVAVTIVWVMRVLF